MCDHADFDCEYLTPDQCRDCPERSESMAEAKKCDVCGSFYERYNTQRNQQSPNYVELCQETKNDSITIYAYDTCPACMDAIQAFIAARKPT